MDYRIFMLKKDRLLGKSYSIFENGAIICKANISWLNWHASLSKLDDSMVYKIKRASFLPQMKFEIFENGASFGYAIKALKVFSSLVELTTAEETYLIKGTFTSKEFTIEKKGMEIAKISRHTVPFRPKKYGIAVHATENVELILAMTLMIELILKVKRARRG